MTDTTGGVLPGVTVTAVHEASGNTFVGVTDDKGIFRLPVKNYNSFVTNLSNVRYGQPSQDTNIAFQPRMLQLGFRLSF